MYRNNKPTPETMEALHALAAVRELSRHASEGPLRIRVEDAKDASPIAIPPEAVEILIDALDGIVAVRGGANEPAGAELGISQAAEILYMEVPEVIKLIENNEIPHRMVGGYPRLRVHDVMEFLFDLQVKRRAVLDQLVAEAQEQNMGY